MAIQDLIYLMLTIIAGLFIPLLSGYAIPLQQNRWGTLIARILHGVIILLIVFMGILFGIEPDIQNMLSSIGWNGALFFGILSASNIGALYLLSRYDARRTQPKQLNTPSPLSPATQKPALTISLWARLGRILKELQILVVLIIGYGIGLWLKQLPHFSIDMVHTGSYILLGAMIFLIGVELRMQGISLAQACLNKKGLAIAVVIIISCWIAAAGMYFVSMLGGENGLIPSMVPLQWREALAATSGFGWYSLSGIIVTQQAGPYLGGLTFSLDLVRELLIILFLPLLTKVPSSIGTGFSGATAMDVTLPFLKKAYGNEIVPIAISSGLLLSLASPLCISLFLHG